jgi:DivIVA domain-containing protein
VSLILMYLMVLILVSAVLFGIASFIFGRGEQLPPLPPATTATVLPASGVTGADVDAVRFTQVLRGYKTSEVDWVLDRLGAELDQLRGELAAVRAAAGVNDADDFGGDGYDPYGYTADSYHHSAGRSRESYDDAIRGD